MYFYFLYVLTTHVTVCACDTEIRGYYLLTYLLTYFMQMPKTVLHSEKR